MRLKPEHKAALANAVLIAHARPGSKREALACEVMGWGKPVYTLDHRANSNLLELGARTMEAAELDGLIACTPHRVCEEEQ
jgi:hypothetical protein